MSIMLRVAALSLAFLVLKSGQSLAKPTQSSQASNTTDSQAQLTSAQIAFLARPIFDSYRTVLADQAILPKPSSDMDRLVRLDAIDQAGRDALEKVDMSKLTAAQRQQVWSAIWGEILPHDASDLEALKKIMPTNGWFAISKYGKEGSKAAFLIVQHADDIKFQEQMLARMEPLFGTPELDGQSYGLLWDRISLRNGRPQRYGSQVHCEHSAYAPINLEDPVHVDDRRKAAGFKQTEEEYMKNFATEPCR